MFYFFFFTFCQVSYYFKQSYNQTSGVKNKHILTDDKSPTLLFINDIIAVSQQDSNLKMTTLMISDLTLNPGFNQADRFQFPLLYHRARQ